MIKVQFEAGKPRWKQYKHSLSRAIARAGLDAELSQNHDPGDVDYLVCEPSERSIDFSAYSKTKAVLSLWAGVENIAANKTLTQPLCRMVDNGLTEGMAEWVAGHVLRHHLGMDAHIVNPGHQWDATPPPLARNRKVGILGLGELGGSCAKTLAKLNFDVAGWSRRPKRIAGIRCCSGNDGLETVLAQSSVLVLLLPLTAETENLIDATRLAILPRGAFLLNPGRGQLIDDEALLNALGSGHLAHATLDVFRQEPLPPDHPFWAHPKITVTPHIAGETRPDTASQSIAENIRRKQAGEPLLHVVDREAGY